MTQTITLSDLHNILNAVKGNTFVGVTYVSELAPSKDYKRSCPLVGNITCKKRYPCQFNHGYKASVDRRADKVGGTPIQSAPLPWGQWSVYNKFITHNGNEYVRFYVEENANIEETYYLNGREMTPSEVATFKSYLYSKGTFTFKQKQADCGVTAKQVHPIAPRISSIVALSLNHTTYIIQ